MNGPRRCALANAGGAIFLGPRHRGPHDSHQPAAAGRATLERLGYAVQWHSLAMGHEIAQEEILALSHWLRARHRGPRASVSPLATEIHAETALCAR